MCGIIGYIGKSNAAPILYSSLKKLEYRGYDSCGMALINGSMGIDMRKGAGRIEAVNDRVDFLALTGNVGIAHTRWATHGKVTDENAHPFMSCNGEYALVHNGILENYLEVSQEAKGAFTFLLLNQKTKAIYAFRKDSPLIIGLGEDGFYASSDITSFLEHTNKAIILENFQLAVLNETCTVIDLAKGNEIETEITTIEWTAEQATKTGFPHYMLKEISEESEISKHSLDQNPAKLNAMKKLLSSATKVFFLGSGTSYRACLLASIYFAKLAKKHYAPILGSEFKTYQNLVDEDTVIFAISQSGETADVLEGIKIAKEKGAKIASLVNVMGSTIMRESDQYLTLNAGPEIAVASTKAFTSQVLILVLLAYVMIDKLDEGKESLLEVVANIDSIIKAS
ncbi:MAG: SIS domain-containing protein, partial [Candidatus Heimdallarchaeota archaeon]